MESQVGEHVVRCQRRLYEVAQDVRGLESGDDGRNAGAIIARGAGSCTCLNSILGGVPRATIDSDEVDERRERRR